MLDPVTIAWLTLVGIGIVQGVRLLSAYFGLDLGTFAVRVVLLAVSVGLLAWQGGLPAFPGLPALGGLEPVALLAAVVGFLGAVLEWLTAVAGAAQLLYSWLVTYVFERLGWTVANVQAARGG